MSKMHTIIISKFTPLLGFLTQLLFQDASNISSIDLSLILKISFSTVKEIKDALSALLSYISMWDF